MKLANALSQRSELQTRIRQLETRLYNNAQVQEGEQPAEDPQELLRELEEDYARLEGLISAVNRTNNATRLEDGTTLSDLLARRDVGACRYFVSDSTQDFARLASIFLGQPVTDPVERVEDRKSVV